jgi:DnaJ-class molecular chaperone
MYELMYLYECVCGFNFFQCHPDKNQSDPTTHIQFVKINEAYRVLSHPDERRAYDLTLAPEGEYNRKHTSFDVYTTRSQKQG